MEVNKERAKKKITQNQKQESGPTFSKKIQPKIAENRLTKCSQIWCTFFNLILAQQKNLICDIKAIKPNFTLFVSLHKNLP